MRHAIRGCSESCSEKEDPVRSQWSKFCFLLSAFYFLLSYQIRALSCNSCNSWFKSVVSIQLSLAREVGLGLWNLFGIPLGRLLHRAAFSIFRCL
jgi:hypothetical protein